MKIRVLVEERHQNKCCHWRKVYNSSPTLFWGSKWLACHHMCCSKQQQDMLPLAYGKS